LIADVRLVVSAAAQGEGREIAAARDALSRGPFSCAGVALPTVPQVLAQTRVLWWHAAERPEPPLWGEELRRWIGEGGRALLTLQAAALVGDFGIESAPPNRVGLFPWRQCPEEIVPPTGARRGLFPFFTHPLFEGLPGGAATVRPVEGASYPEAVYAGGAWPGNGRAIAREIVSLDLDPTRVVAWEVPHGRGIVLCIGAHFLFEETSSRGTLERLAENAIRYLLERRDARSRPRPWPRPSLAVSPFAFEEIEAPVRARVPPRADGGQALESRGGSDAFFDVAGLEALVLGQERSGVLEVWTGALRAVAGRRVRFRPVSGKEWMEEGSALERFRTRPFGVERVFRVGSARIVERIVPDRGSPAAVFDWSVEEGSVEEIELEWAFDHRLFWPAREGGAGSLRTAWSEAARLFAVRDEADRLAAVVGFDRAPIESPRIETTRRGEAPAVRFTARFAAGDGLRAIVAGSEEGHLDAVEILRATEGRGEREFAAAAEAGRRALEDRLLFESPEGEIDEAFRWAGAKLLPFVQDFPRIGRGLAAGFATTRSGWGSGRPGYAWLFGRDTCWSSHALLSLGRPEGVLGSLEAMIRLQNADGKILHEATPSGAVHFDAADSNPLFLVAVDRYVRWTGDVPFLERHRGAILRAHRFAAATDADGDGLIENAGVGHGWVEGGPLHEDLLATFYLNACWAEALRSTARIARRLGEEELSRSCEAWFARLRPLLNERFFHAETRGFRFALRRDGSPIEAATVEAAVGILFGLLDEANESAFLEALAGPGFSAPHGVRFLPRDHPAYDPGGYHHGSVWPLFTGWSALAEYRAHRPETALRRVRANLARVRQGTLGCIEEVLHGETGEPAGVCPHQAWSHALAISPVTAGLLGLDPDAASSGLRLVPHLPASWDRLRVRNVCFGSHDLGIAFERRGEGLDVRFEPRSEGPISVALSPAFERGARIDAVRLDGRTIPHETFPGARDVHVAVRFELRGAAEVVFG
jgi:hypothetical protein